MATPELLGRVQAVLRQGSIRYLTLARGYAVVHRGIARLWKPVVNVTDLDEGERFWSAVAGLSPTGRHEQFSSLDLDDPEDGDMWLLLQLVPQGQVSRHAGTHLDLRVDDVAEAARQIVEIGGEVIRPPGYYRPEGVSEDMLEWAVMRDPFGNEFCIIRWPL